MKHLLKNIQRLSWRFSERKQFTPNQADIDALNGIIQWANREKEERINQNRYFAKIVIYTLMRELDYFEDINLAERKLHDILERPLEYWYDRVRLNFIMREFEITYKILGINNIAEIWDMHKGLDGYFDMGQVKYEAHNSNELIKNHKDDLIKALKTWPQKEINDKINYFITELLNEHGNKP